MYEIGDIVLRDVFVGVVVGTEGDTLICNCSDGTVHKFPQDKVGLVTKYRDMLEAFRKGILVNVGR